MEWVIPWGDLARIALAGGAMWLLLATTLGRLPGSVPVLLAEIALGVVLYIVGILLVGAVRPDERAYVRELGGRAWKRLMRRES